MATPPAPTFHVVAHTHWDREWYHTAERFRQRLVALVDELLDDPPAPGTSFLLDGQAVLLDDYLAVRPERAGELSALLRDGRLEAGPWYVLADELIPGGEALVRNLLAGRETVRRLRGEPPPVLYCPDSFGHPAILPELAHGFGCTLVVLWRGYGGARWPTGDTARWRGPTGHEVVLFHLPPDGYEFGSSLPVDAAGAAERWVRIRDTMLPRASSSAALLLNGADHHARQRGQVDAVAALARAAGDVDRIVASSLADAAAAIVRAASAVELPVVMGELRDSYGYTWTLGGTLATRAAQKRRNALCERALVRDVEPWLLLAPRGDPATRALLHAAWRDLLLGHPHDTLCGTSIDAVAEALDQRLAVVEGQVAGLREDALLALVEHDREAARADTESWRPALVLRNPAARPRGGVAELTITRKVADVAVGPGSARRQGEAREPEPLPATVQALASRRYVSLTESPRAYPRAELVEETRALAWVERIGGYTVQTRLLADVAPAAPPREVVVAERQIENGLLRATVSSRGQVRLELATGRVVEDAVSLQLLRDVGDLYTPAIRPSLGAFTLEECETTQAGPLRGELSLRFGDGGASWVVMRLQLDAGLPALRIVVSGSNARTDMQLRLVVGTGLDGGAATLADAAFHPVARAIPVISEDEAAMEQVVRIAPLHRFVSRYSADAGATLFSDGLAAYECLNDGRIAVTLVRAVGELSRADLPERPGHAGWPASTPGAQSMGPWEARFALALHGPDTPAQRNDVERLADDVLLPVTGETLRSNLRDAVRGGGLELEGDGLAFSAAMPARAPGWITLRCVNRRDVPVEGCWRIALHVHEARLARLDETPGTPLVVTNGAIAFTAAPMEIVTIVARV